MGHLSSISSQRRGNGFRRTVVRYMLAPLLLVGLSACSTHYKSVSTTESEKTVYPDEHYSSADALDHPEVMEEKTKTETHEEEHHAEMGVLSGTVHVIGETIALPFRAVAGLLEVIF